MTRRPPLSRDQVRALHDDIRAWRQIKRDWSQKGLARKYGISLGSFHKHAQRVTQ